jgi:hypothetical protein
MKTSNAIYMSLLCAALAACGALPREDGAAAGKDAKGAAPAAAPQPIVGTWFSPPSDFPGICMHFSADGAPQTSRSLHGGALEFSGGFAFYNPAFWQHDSAARELRIALGGSEDFPAPLEAAKPLEPNQGALLRADADKRVLTYRLGSNTDMIDIAGFKFYRNRACVAEK